MLVYNRKGLQMCDPGYGTHKHKRMRSVQAYINPSVALHGTLQTLHIHVTVLLCLYDTSFSIFVLIFVCT